eukprot:scaffold99822_cov60-Phaeocystis_antarctica.AAC.5
MLVAVESPSARVHAGRPGTPARRSAAGPSNGSSVAGEEKGAEARGWDGVSSSAYAAALAQSAAALAVAPIGLHNISPKRSSKSFKLSWSTGSSSLSSAAGPSDGSGAVAHKEEAEESRRRTSPSRPTRASLQPAHGGGACRTPCTGRLGTHRPRRSRRSSGCMCWPLMPGAAACAVAA